MKYLLYKISQKHKLYVMKETHFKYYSRPNIQFSFRFIIIIINHRHLSTTRKIYRTCFNLLPLDVITIGAWQISRKSSSGYHSFSTLVFIYSNQSADYFIDCVSRIHRGCVSHFYALEKHNSFHNRRKTFS